ncbi:hypothetical protein [Mycolicibacterium houstonense]|uniref:hypothetical protein n=1 Tax=Mycolicibacterium houstonense TaxID=146021 RepID=UPI003F9D80F8
MFGTIVGLPARHFAARRHSALARDDPMRASGPFRTQIFQVSAFAETRYLPAMDLSEFGAVRVMKPLLASVRAEG